MARRMLCRQHIAPATICTYLAAVRYAQVVRELPEPREQSMLPRLRLMQSGVHRDRAQRGPRPGRQRLPITPPILRQMHLSWREGHDNRMLWAVALSCFFGFFHAEEMTIPSVASFNPAVHLAWGDVASDREQSP